MNLWVKEAQEPATLDEGIRRVSEEDEDDDDEVKPHAPLRIPPTQIPTFITLEQLVKEQLKDEDCLAVRTKLQAELQEDNNTSAISRQYEMTSGGVLCRLTQAGNELHDSLRPYIPKSLRQTIMQNHHNSIWGMHRSEKTTFREVASRFFWPGITGRACTKTSENTSARAKCVNSAKAHVPIGKG